MRLLLTTLILLTLVPAARGDAIALSVDPDPMEEVGFGVRVSGTAETRSHLTVSWAEDGDCAGEWGDVLSEDGIEGPFSYERVEIREDPGDHVLCAVLEASDDGRPPTRGSLTVPVRGNAASIELRVPPGVPADRRVRATVHGSTELGRDLEVVVVAGSRCPSAIGSVFSGGRSLLDEELFPGPFVIPMPLEVASYGRYSVCAFVGEDGRRGVAASEAAASAPLLVTPMCNRGWRAVGLARGALRRARARLDQAWRPTARLRGAVTRAEQRLLAAREARRRACSAPEGA